MTLVERSITWTTWWSRADCTWSKRTSTSGTTTSSCSRSYQTRALGVDAFWRCSGNHTKHLIYTSGTAGMPRGTVILTGRWINTARDMAEYLRLKPGDRFYTCLPLYNGAAQGLRTAPVVCPEASMALGRKFSHKTFWPEVSASGANKLWYVGEPRRYLVNAPPHPLERQHRVEMAWGNDMRHDVWEMFRQRFNILIIHELYAANDGIHGSHIQCQPRRFLP